MSFLLDDTTYVCKYINVECRSNETGEMYIEMVPNVSNIILNPNLPTMSNFGIRYTFV